MNEIFIGTVITQQYLDKKIDSCSPRVWLHKIYRYVLTWWLM